MKAGLGTYAFMWSIGFQGARSARPMRAVELVEKAAQLGVEVVQFGPNLALYELPRAELDEVLAACRQYGLELEVGARGLEAGHLDRLAEFTRACGAGLLRTVPDYDLASAPALEALTGTLRDVEPAFRAAQVRLAIENSVIPAATLAQALNAVASPWIGVTLDTVNSLAIPEGTSEVVSHLARFTFCLHVKDFVVRREPHLMGFRVEGRPAGQGQLNVPALVGELRRQGVRANAILELWPPPQATLADTIALEQRWAEESIPYLKQVLKEES